MPLTEYACPLCPTDDPGQIGAGNGALTCQKNPAHIWNDVKSFKDLNPEMRFKVADAKFPAQVNHVKMEVTVPLAVKTRLETKWGVRVSQTVSGVLEMMSEGDVLIVPESDCDRIRKLTNHKPGSSAELFGILFALDQQATDAKNEVEMLRKDVAAYEGRSSGYVMVNIADIQSEIQSRAQEANLPVKLWLEDKLKTAIQNSWF